jgi:hypothetical protein
MNEANTLADVIGPVAGSTLPPAEPTLTVTQLNELALGFCGYLTADVPELHGIHPQRLADAWKRYTARVADGSILGFAQNGEG